MNTHPDEISLDVVTSARQEFLARQTGAQECQTKGGTHDIAYILDETGETIEVQCQHLRDGICGLTRSIFSKGSGCYSPNPHPSRWHHIPITEGLTRTLVQLDD